MKCTKCGEETVDQLSGCERIDPYGETWTLKRDNSGIELLQVCEACGLKWITHFRYKGTSERYPKFLYKSSEEYRD